MKPLTSEVPRPPVHRNTKRTGELSEAAFLLKAETLGFHLAKPWGDSERYDFILDTGARRWRVQIKCTEALRARGYDVQPIYSVYGKGKIVYTADDIDVLVASILPSPSGTSCPSKSSPQTRTFASIRTRSASAPAGNSTAKPGTSSTRVGRTLLSAAFDRATQFQSQSGQPTQTGARNQFV
jgi:hypothetical protein